MGKLAQVKSSKGRGVLLTEGVIWKQLLLFALPLLLSSFLQQLYNTADLLIVGRYAGDTALAAVGATGSLTNLMVGFFIGLSTGASVVISQQYGSGDTKDLRDSIHSGILLAMVGGLILSVMGYILSRPLLQFMGTPDDILNEAAIYMKINFLGMLPLLVYNMGAGILRAMGDSRRPLYLLILSSIINIVLDLIFILPLGMGVAGAAWATIIAQIVVAVIVILMLQKLDGGYHLSLKELKFHPHSLKKILAIGLPAGLQSAAVNFSNVVIQSNINAFGSAAVGGVAAAGRIDGFLFMIANAFGLSAMTFVGQNVGAGKFDRAKKSARVTLLISSGAVITLGVLFALFAENILHLFNSNPEVIAYGQLMVRTLAPLYWIFGITEGLSGVLRGAGMSIPPMVITVTCFTAVRLLWINLMLPVRNDIWIVFLSWPVSWAVGAIASVILIWRSDWLKKTQDAYADRMVAQKSFEASKKDLTSEEDRMIDVDHVSGLEQVALAEASSNSALVDLVHEPVDSLLEVHDGPPESELSPPVQESLIDDVQEAEDEGTHLDSQSKASALSQEKESYHVRDEKGDTVLYVDEAASLSPDVVESIQQSYEETREALELRNDEEMIDSLN